MDRATGPSSRRRGDAATLRRRRISAAAGAAAALWCADAAAQQVLPGPADPSRIDQRLQQPIQPTSRPALELEGPEFEPPPAQAFAIRFDLTDVVVEGVEAYPAAEFEALYAELRGTSVSLLDVYRVRDAITTRYRNDGYVLSQALIPAQRVEGGVVRIRVVEGFVNDVLFEGDVPDAAQRFASSAEAIRASRPLRIDVLERHLLLLDDLPGIDARTVLRPAEGVTGGTDLVFVLERQLWRGQVGVNNRGSKSIGPWQADAYAEGNTLDGRLSARTVAAAPLSELALVDVGYAHWIGDQGTSLSFGVRRNWSSPGVELNKIESVTSSVRFGVNHPLIRSRTETLRLGLEFSGRETQSSVGQTAQGSTEDRIRVLAASLSYDWADSLGGTNVLQLTYTQGLPILNSIDGRPASAGRLATSRADGNDDFWKLGLTFQRVIPLAERWGASFLFQGQYTDVALFSSEEFGIGGSSLGLAYDPSAVTGDIGYGAKLEITRTLAREEAPGVQLFWYFDHGRVDNWRRGDVAGGNTGQTFQWQVLNSTGFGARMQFPGGVSSSVTAAKPLNDHQATGDQVWRLFFTLSASF
jgi:hemolysin activation/secretion protein